MCKGWRLLLTAAMVALGSSNTRAADNEPQIRCEIRVLRVSDECYEKMCQRATVQPKPKCCDQSACCAKSSCCEKQTCGEKSACCEKSNCCEKPACCPKSSCCEKSNCCEKPACCPKSSCCEQQTCGEKSSCCDKSNCCEKPACCPKPCCEPAQKSCRALPAIMPASRVKVVMEAVQSDSGCDMMCCPRVTTLDGQTAAVRVGSCESFVTLVRQVRFNGQDVAVPSEEQLPTGMQLTVRPTVAPDGRSVILSVNCQLTERNCQTAPLFPIQTTITPVYEGGAQGKPIPFTQFIQQPSFTTRGAHRFAVCGEGQTMVLDCGRATRVRETDTSVPFLSDLPVVGELFQSKSTEVISDRLVVFVTPCVCTGEAGEECTTPTAKACEELPLFAQPAMCEPETLPVAPRPCTPPCVAPCPTAACPTVAAVTQATAAVAPCGMWMMATPAPPPVPCCPAQAAACPFACPVPPPPPVRMVRAAAAVMPSSASDLPLVNLMIEYHEACAAGDKAKARNLAAKCIALDPTCFSR